MDSYFIVYGLKTAHYVASIMSAPSRTSRSTSHAYCSSFVTGRSALMHITSGDQVVPWSGRIQCTASHNTLAWEREQGVTFFSFKPVDGGTGIEGTCFAFKSDHLQQFISGQRVKKINYYA